mmetsp:Transcript_26665/g.40111  ORF Transcript_26665/g.40111 Transcript_26665/m.40111 type:complete len:93 (-) Transcript_26665:180-458(-)
MKIEPAETMSPLKNPKPTKWKSLLSRKRSKGGKKKNKKKCGKGKVTPVQPGSHKKVERHQIAGTELLGTDTIRKEAIKVLQLCEEPRRTSSQ